MENKKIYTLGTVLMIFFILLAWLCGAWMGLEIASQLFAAIAGAIIAAIITMLLLQGQTATEEVKERNTKVFEEKLSVYKSFLEKLCDSLEDGEITTEEAIHLQFSISHLAMIHTSSEHIKQISECVKNIMAADDVKQENNKSKSETILENLFGIVQCMKEELYSKEEKNIDLPYNDDENIKQAIKNFCENLEATKAKEIAEIKTSDWNSFVYNIEKLGWKSVEEDLGKNSPIRYKKEFAHFGVDYEEGWYFWADIKDHNGLQHDVYQHLKWKFGGKYSQENCWWIYFPKKDNFIKRPNLMEDLQNGENKDFSNYVLSMLTAIATYMDSLIQLLDEIHSEIRQLPVHSWPYFERCLAIDYDGKNNSTVIEDRPFIDVILNKNSYEIQTSSRYSNTDGFNLSDFINKYGLDQGEKNGSRLCYKNLTKEECLSKIRVLDKKFRKDL
ncbi:MAG: hypothetical protein MJ197_02525 [Bacteroidales bacterium]|nr:hypothetical protein [Bacteroidales bacterium]MCQ2960483.1 hypothetical protein [Bacteroidales bacterium]